MEIIADNKVQTRASRGIQSHTFPILDTFSILSIVSQYSGLHAIFYNGQNLNLNLNLSPVLIWQAKDFQSLIDAVFSNLYSIATSYAL